MSNGEDTYLVGLADVFTEAQPKARVQTGGGRNVLVVSAVSPSGGHATISIALDGSDVRLNVTPNAINQSTNQPTDIAVTAMSTN
jgi:hypothetical protein